MGERRVKVASWNVMAPEYAARMASGRDFYAKVRDWMPWHDRLPRILQHLAEVDAELVFLQEVSQAHVDGPLRIGLEKLGYELAVARKTNVFQPDGLVLAHRGGRGKIVADDVCGFRDDTGYVAQLRTIRLEKSDFSITLANAHLKWSADEETPARQLRVLLERLDAMPPSPRIVCGDLNYDVLAHESWTELAARGFTTAYPDPSAHSWAADGRTAKLDGLLFSREFRLIETRPLPVLDPVIGLPGPQMPSDHVPLVATLALATP